MPLDDAFNLFRDPLNSNLPWPGALTGAIIKSLWYWCADQVWGLFLFESKAVVFLLGVLHVPLIAFKLDY